MSQPYPSYKDSGYEWLGQVPRTWPIVRLGTCFDERREKVSDKDFPALSVTMQGVVPQINTAARTNDGDNRKLVRVGDLVINSRSDRMGSSGLAKQEGSVSLINTVLIPRSQIAPGFAEWIFRSRMFQHEFYRWGRGIVDDLWTTKYTEMRNIRLALPPFGEQRTIAAFLDRETGKIDAAVEEQRRLIALLKEKRQAVISHAVTKGLNPDAPMKPSGIDWLGDIPEHWAIGRLKHDLAFLTSGSRGWAAHYADDGSLFLRIGNLTRETLGLSLDDVQRVAVPQGTEGERTRVQAGDLLFSITAYLGSIAVVPDDLETAYVSQHVALARLRQRRLRPKWAGYVTLSVVGRTYLDEQGYGGTKVQLALDDVANLVMPIPPLDEQERILGYIETETTELDTLISEAETAIDLLQERRSALISAAVTGKIDVRDEVAEQQGEQSFEGIEASVGA